MKELYTSPELKLINFVSEENLASSVDFNDLISSAPASMNQSDIVIEF